MKHISYAKIAVNKIANKSFGVLELVVLGIIVISAISYALAWQAPTGNPPVGNTDAPLNIGSTGQTKIGGLLLNSGGAPNGLIVQNGNVGIGMASPTQKLSVAGIIESTSGGIKFPDGTIQTTAAVGGSGNQWIASGSNIYYILGNVGIGTTSPTYKLDVAGEARFKKDGANFIMDYINLGEDNYSSWVTKSCTGRGCSYEGKGPVDSCDGDKKNPYTCFAADNKVCADLANYKDVFNYNKRSVDCKKAIYWRAE